MTIYQKQNFFGVFYIYLQIWIMVDNKMVDFYFNSTCITFSVLFFKQMFEDISSSCQEKKIYQTAPEEQKQSNRSKREKGAV